jgi:zinc-ribbon domain
MAFSAGNPGAGWPGMWWGMGGMGFFWIFPLFGLVMMLTMMFFFIGMFTGRGGPMDWMFGNRPRDNQSRPPFNVGDSVCPSCGSTIQPDWNVCPHCGTNLKK